MVNLVNMFTRLCFIFTYLPSSTFPPISRLDISHSAWIHILGRVILSCWDCGQTFDLDPQNKFQIYPIFADSFPTIPGQNIYCLIFWFMFLKIFMCWRNNEVGGVWKKDEKGFHTGKSHSQISFVTKDFFCNLQQYKEKIENHSLLSKRFSLHLLEEASKEN